MNEIHLEALRAGHRVSIENSIAGEVVFVARSSSYALDFPESEWPIEQYDGLMIRQDNGALIFHQSSLFDTGELIIYRMEASPN